MTLFRGFPFPPGTSSVEQVDPRTGSHSPLITGLKTAIDVLPINGGEEGDDDDDRDADDHRNKNDDDDDDDGDGNASAYLVLQHASGPILSGPGLLLRFETPVGPPTVIASCLNSPTSMTLHKKTGTLYVTELFTGRVVAVNVAQ